MGRESDHARARVVGTECRIIAIRQLARDDIERSRIVEVEFIQFCVCDFPCMNHIAFPSLRVARQRHEAISNHAMRMLYRNERSSHDMNDYKRSDPVDKTLTFFGGGV